MGQNVYLFIQKQFEEFETSWELENKLSSLGDTYLCPQTSQFLTSGKDTGSQLLTLCMREVWGDVTGRDERGGEERGIRTAK